MTDIVERIKVEQWTNRDGEDVTSYKVSLVNETGQREVPCYDPRGKDLKEDSPLPEGWEVKTSKAGKLYLAAPKQSSGGGGRPFNPATGPAAWRNTEAGAKYEQERMDRRTALMQAIAYAGPPAPDEPIRSAPFQPLYLLEFASNFYTWLRESVGAEQNSRVTAGLDPAKSTARPAAPTPSDEGGEMPQASAPPSSSTAVPVSAAAMGNRFFETHFEKVPADACHCGQPYGTQTTATGKRLCLGGHVEKFDYA